MAEFASKGVAGTGLGLGIAGTALGLMNGGLGNLFGNFNGCNNGCGYNNNGCGCCSDDHLITRYEAKQAGTIAQKDSEIALLKSESFTEKKIADVFERLNVRLVDLEKDTAVNTQRINDNIAFVNNRIDNEADKLKCYVDAHFVPGRLTMPLDSICPPAAPLCKPTKANA